jgi:hypothetical protein
MADIHQIPDTLDLANSPVVPGKIGKLAKTTWTSVRLFITESGRNRSDLRPNSLKAVLPLAILPTLLVDGVIHNDPSQCAQFACPEHHSSLELASVARDRCEGHQTVIEKHRELMMRDVLAWMIPNLSILQEWVTFSC